MKAVTGSLCPQTIMPSLGGTAAGASGALLRQQTGSMYTIAALNQCRSKLSRFLLEPRKSGSLLGTTWASAGGQFIPQTPELAGFRRGDSGDRRRLAAVFFSGAGQHISQQGHYHSTNWKLQARGNLSAQSATTSTLESTSGRGAAATGPPVKRGEGSMVDVNPPRGTRDFAPEDMRLRNWLFDNFRDVSKNFGFEEVDYPVLESEELFVRKAGEEIVQQLYNFEDKGGRRLALRPELTPSLARLVLQKGKAVPYPLKWFVIGQCWRYERMTRGRRREHYQWNMDIVGIEGVEAEAELLSAIVSLLTRLGLTSQDIGIKVSNRKVLHAFFEKQGIPDNLFGPVCVVVDKIEKIGREGVEKELLELGVEVAAISSVLEVLSLRSLDDLEAQLGSSSDAVADLRRLFALAEAYGIADWLLFDASVVRGLAYYTGTVFEGCDRAGKLRAIFGGGRYDRLLSTLGGEDAPACGFGFGDAVIVELLKDKGLLPSFGHKVDDVVVALEAAVQPQAAAAAARLRAGGRVVDLVLENKKMKWAFKHAERLKAARLVIVGSEEAGRGVVKVKDLSTREETETPLTLLE